ncbi:hypothetical protein [Maridesulfovibrio sp.]|uniref:hypothetical protein n=1 Tax=unclassified Maridesulfovibrio TaxID=2794999 RepID=UPI003AFF8912
MSEKIFRVVSVEKGKEPYTLFVTWEDGQHGLVDVSSYVANYKSFECLRGDGWDKYNPQVGEYGGTVDWVPDEVDITSDTLRVLWSEQMKQRSVILEHDLAYLRQTKKEQIVQRRHMHQALVQSGANAVKAILVISGGSFVAMLAYIGQLKARNLSLEYSLVIAMILLGCSGVLALLNSGVTHLIYMCHAKNIYKGGGGDTKEFKQGKFLENVAIFLWVLSFVSLVIGGIYCLSGILS